MGALMTQIAENRPNRSALSAWSSRMAKRALLSLCLIVLGANSACGGAPLPKFLMRPTPTPRCVEPTLTLGSAKYRIESLARAADGSFVVPPDKPNLAYWIEGTSARYVFALSPTPNNLTLKDTVKNGDPATIVWADCGSDEYVVSGLEVGPQNYPALLDQSSPGIAVFVQAAPPSQLVFKGARPTPQAPQAPSPTQAPDEIRAEVVFGDTITSPDKKTLKMSVTITNTGAYAFSIAPGDISLTPANAAPLAPLSVEPTLPQEIKPGMGASFQITFPRPAGNTAVFKLLDLSADIYF